MTKNKNTKETKVQKEEIIIKEIEEPEKVKNTKDSEKTKEPKTKEKKTKKSPIEDLDETLGISKTKEDTDFGDVPEFLKQNKKKNKEEIPNFMKY